MTAATPPGAGGSDRNPAARATRADALWVAAAAVLGAVFLLVTRRDPVFRVPYLDAAFYHTWARSLAAGTGDFQGPYFLGPLYPWALSFLYRITGPEPFAARVVQTTLFVLDAALVLDLGRRLFGRAAARAALLLFALYGPLLFYGNLLVMEMLLLTLCLAALWLLVVPGRFPVARAAVAGLLLGWATLGRPTVVLAAPAAFLALRDARARRALVAACAAGWIVAVAPVLARNARLGAGPVVSTNGGINFYAGNSPDANGRFHAPPGVRFFATPVPDVGPDQSLPPAVAARALTVRAVAGTETAADSRIWTRRALEWMASDPLGAAGLFLRRAWLVLQAREIAQIESYAFHASRLPLLRVLTVDFGWLWPLAALGLWKMRRERHPHCATLVGWGGAMLAPCLLFFVTSRYRLAVVPVATLAAGYGAATLLAWLHARAWRRAALALLLLAPLAVATRVGARPPRGAAGWEAAQMAERLYALGDLGGAIEFQSRAAAALPERFEPSLNLALYWSERGLAKDDEQAEALVRQLLRRWPGEAVLHFNLGVLLEAEGRLDEAESAYREAIRADPGFGPARSRLLRTPGAPKPPADAGR